MKAAESFAYENMKQKKLVWGNNPIYCIKRISLILIITVFLLSICINPVSAEKAEFYSGWIDVPFDDLQMQEIEKAKADTLMYAKGDTDCNKAIPSSYDLRDHGLITGVRSQGDYGTCWAHSAIASVESNLIKNGYADASINLSELQLAYFFYNREGVTHGTAVSKLSGLIGDNVEPVGDNYLNRGGNTMYTLYHLAAGIGITDESTVPYSKAKPSLTLSTNLAADANKYLVTDAEVVYTSDRNKVQQMLMSKGAGSISYYSGSETSTIVDWTSLFEWDETYVQYQNEHSETNHAVCLAGWDDNFPASAFSGTFRTGDTPPGNGAWLIKNSWDDDWGDDGYFWLSYYDASVQDEPVYFFTAVPASEYDTIYQYDGGVAYWYYSGTACNVFTAPANQKITAVGFAAGSSSNSYTIEIKDKNENSLLKQTGTLEKSGYHTVKLMTPVYFAKGDKFSIYITANNIVYDYTLDGGWLQSTSSSVSGQSYKVVNGVKSTDISRSSQNFRIKAYGNNVNKIPVNVPVAVSGLVYTGQSQTGVKTGIGYTLTGNTGTNAGSYTAVAALDANYIWSDGSTGTKEISWSIAKKPIAVPAAVNGLVYTGQSQTGVKTDAGYTLTGNTGTNAGSYTAVAALDANYIWSDGSTGTKQISWSIAKKPIAVPAAVNGLVYTGQSQTGVKTDAGYTLSGNTGTNAGSYTAVASLIDPRNYKWGDGTGAPKNILWEIARKPVGIPTAISGIVYNGEERTGVKAYSGSTISGNTGTDAGTYTAEASLTDPLNYQWVDGTTLSRLISWHISYRTLTLNWPDTSSLVFDGNEHTFIPEASNIVENEDVSLVLSGCTSAIQPGKYTVEITGITGADAENYCLPVSLKQTKKNWYINYSGEGFCFITEVKETEKYDWGRIFTGTVSLDGVTDLIAGTAGFTLKASDASITISDIKPADAKSGWQFTVNSETDHVSLYGGKKTLTGKTPLVTFTARVPDKISFPAEITVVPDSLVCGPSYSNQVSTNLSGIAVIPAEITQDLSQAKLTARMPEPPVITTGRILIPVCLENDIDFAGFMAVIANDIPGVSVEITDEEPIPGCSYAKDNPESSNLKISGFTMDPVYDSSIHLFTLKISVINPSVSHISIPVVLEELISDVKGDVLLDFVSAEYDIELDVSLERSLTQPVIEQKSFNAETRAEIDVIYPCPELVLPELCDKDNCIVPVYRTNPSEANGSYLHLKESFGFETYVKDTDYTYTDDGALSFSEEGRALQSNEETFVFRSDYCLGDVNQDGKVSAADATAICYKLLDENSEWTPKEVFYGKISGEAHVPTVLDALTIAKYTVGLVDADYKPV